jgi:hypothetical protein
MRGEGELGATVRRPPRLPDTLQIGDFTLEVETYSDSGEWDPVDKRFREVSGTAWLSFHCADLPGLIVQAAPLDNYPRFSQSVEVVARVVNPQTQVSLVTAQRIQPGIQLGETLRVETTLSHDAVQKIVADEMGLADWLERFPPKGQVLVGFENVTIVRTTQRGVGRIVQGSAVYPTQPRIPKQLQLSLAGFTLILHSLTLTPDRASADVTVQLPGGLAERDACTPATLKLGEVAITPRCALYVDAPGAEFGPWIVGDSGLVISGTGYTLDLSLADSPPPKPSAWRGLMLHNGRATGADLVPDPANTGYLSGQFSFSNAELTIAGLNAHLALSQIHTFQALHPLGYVLTLEAGWLKLTDTRVSGGEFGPGQIELPGLAICEDTPGNLIIVSFSQLTVQSNLDLVGEVEFGSVLRLSWGELTHVGSEVVAWTLEARQGFLYLPANPLPSFCPADASGFIDLSLSSAPGYSLTQIEGHGAAGLTLRDLHDLQIFSPDRPGGVTNPLNLADLDGWLRIGCQGVDGELETIAYLEDQKLGKPDRPGYVGKEPFKASLFTLDKPKNLVAQYAASAVYDAGLNGHLEIPEPCKIAALAFQDMELTSTAHLVGGDVVLPVDGVTLDYWQLQLVPTGDPKQAGVVSVRTGRIVFTAAGIDEPIHFALPFRLTWGEMLANGNLGELFFDYNNYGQRFDLIPYAPQNIILSEYVSGATDAYLATCGTVHFNFFGPRFVNLRDARYDEKKEPYKNRYVTAPKTGEAGCPPTDLHLAKTWDDLTGKALTDFDFPDAQMDYFVKAQNGFIGSGKCSISFLHSDGLDARIEIHHDAIDIHLSSHTTHDLDLGLYARLGGMREIYGCARIEGPLLSRISLYGLLEKSTATGMGILSPKAGYSVEVNLTSTPNSLDFTASGDLLLQVEGSAVDLSASVHLLRDFSRDSAEGEVIGRIDCNTILGGLEGDGQVTWYADPTMAYLQGRMKVYLCGWIGSGGMEGGMFIGHDVNKALAWILHTDSEHFGVSDNILPAKLTGIFGYGQGSFGWNAGYIFGGGIELYAGMGAFSESPGLSGVWPTNWSAIPGLGLPYVIGSGGMYIHGEILGGVVSASAWADLDLRGPAPIYYKGTCGLEGCALWVMCKSVNVTAGLSKDGIYLFGS